VEGRCYSTLAKGRRKKALPLSTNEMKGRKKSKKKRNIRKGVRYQGMVILPEGEKKNQNKKRKKKKKIWGGRGCPYLTVPKKFFPETEFLLRTGKEINYWRRSRKREHWFSPEKKEIRTSL